MSALWLLQEGADVAPRELPAAGTLVVGSSSDRADLVVEGSGVDAAHCAIGRLKGGGWALKDLGSSEGTRVNGKPVTSARLSAGDSIELGALVLRVVEAGAAGPTPAPVATTTRHVVPKQIGGYRIQRVLGKGGMGTVYLAVQESLDREVALKVLSPKLAADADFVVRFQSEARAAAALSHPNVVVVHDVGEGEGHHFLSMEYMQRGCLETQLKNEGVLPWREALSVLRDAASGLVFAEERNVVHRDIKPANLMQNAVGTTKIADLGLATSVEAEVSMSGGRKIFGTPHFISPEQARGEPVDARSDLYSLGATAYRLMSGHTPFEGETTKDILRGVLRDEPVPLSERVEGLPTGVSDMVQRLLAKDAGARQASARELVSELTHLSHIAGDPVSAERARKLPRLAAGVAGAALLGAILWIGFGRGGADETPEVPGINGTGGSAGSTGGPASVAGAGGPQDTGATGVAANNGGTPGIREETGALAPLTPETGGRDTEAELELLELRAELALKDASNLEADEERLAALRAVADDFPGATAATTAVLEAGALEAEMAASQARVSRLKTVVDSYRANLRSASVPPGDALTPAAAIAALRALPAPAAVDLDTEAARAVQRGVEAEVVARAKARVSDAVDQLNTQLERGEFEPARRSLEKLLLLFEGLDEVADAPEQTALLAAQEAELRKRLANLESESERFALARSRASRAQLFATLGGGAGLERDLEQLRLEPLAEKLEGATDTLAEPQLRAWSESLVTELRAGQRALETLAREFDADGWERRSVLDPRSRRSGAREVVNAGPDGLWFERDGEREIVAWSEYAGHTRHLDQLFRDRLRREWTPAELGEIESLMRITAVVEAAQPALVRLAAMDANGVLPDWESDALESAAEAFALASTWSARTGRSQQLDREQAALELLVLALDQLAAQAWPSAAALLEELLTTYAGTLTVVLFSDGSAWRASLVEAPAGTEGD